MQRPTLPLPFAIVFQMRVSSAGGHGKGGVQPHAGDGFSADPATLQLRALGVSTSLLRCKQEPASARGDLSLVPCLRCGLRDCESA